MGVKPPKLTEKYQATIPAEVSDALKLYKGDLEWAKFVEKTLSEWMSTNDKEAYRDL